VDLEVTRPVVVNEGSNRYQRCLGVATHWGEQINDETVTELIKR